MLMVLPLVPVIAALTSGGSLVAHSAGGLIVSSVAGSYIAGTYISTAALASFLTGSALAVGAVGTAAVGGAAVWAYGTAAGAAISLVGGAGFFGTTIGATGITGFLMRAGVLSSVSILVPAFVGFCLLLLIGIGAFHARKVRRLRKKVLSITDSDEAIFTNREAKLVENLLWNASKTHGPVRRVLMKFFGRKSVLN